MKIIGVDPGMQGAIALLHDGVLMDVVDMPVIAKEIDQWALTELFKEWIPVDMAGIEDVHAVQGAAAHNTFKFGFGLGMIYGILGVLKCPTTKANPVKWTQFHNVGKDKDLHRRRAMELHPEKADLFKLKKHDGRADAVLIADWTFMQYRNYNAS